MHTYIYLPSIFLVVSILCCIFFKIWESDFIGTLGLIAFICCFISIPVCCTIDTYYSGLPENKYNELKEAKIKADKDLEKFLVEYPEYKEVTE